MKDEKTMSRWFVLSLIVLIYITGHVAIYVTPPLFIEIIQQIPLTKAQMGSSMGIIVLASLVFSPMGGILSDRIGCRWAIGMGVFIAAVSSGLRAYVDSPMGLIACMFGIGAGFFIVVPSIPKVLGTWFLSKELAFANGISIAGAGIGIATGNATGASILSPLLGGWRMTMLVLGALFLITGIVWAFLYRDPHFEGGVEEEQKGMFENLKTISRLKDIRFLTLLLAIMTFGFQPVVVFLPISLQERGVAHAGELVAIIGAMSVVFNIAGGKISDKLGRRKPILLLGPVLAGVCVLTYSSLTGLPLILVLMLTGASFGALAPILFTLPPEMEGMKPEMIASAIGFMFMFQSTGGFLGPMLIGKLIDVTGSYVVGFACMGVVIIVSAMFALPIKETGKGAETHHRPGPEGN